MRMPDSRDVQIALTSRVILLGYMDDIKLDLCPAMLGLHLPQMPEHFILSGYLLRYRGRPGVPLDLYEYVPTCRYVGSVQTSGVSEANLGILTTNISIPNLCLQGTYLQCCPNTQNGILL